VPAKRHHGESWKQAFSKAQTARANRLWHTTLGRPATGSDPHQGWEAGWKGRVIATSQHQRAMASSGHWGCTASTEPDSAGQSKLSCPGGKAACLKAAAGADAGKQMPQSTAALAVRCGFRPGPHVPACKNPDPRATPDGRRPALDGPPESSTNGIAAAPVGCRSGPGQGSWAMSVIDRPADRLIAPGANRPRWGK